MPLQLVSYKFSFIFSLSDARALADFHRIIFSEVSGCLCISISVSTYLKIVLCTAVVNAEYQNDRV